MATRTRAATRKRVRRGPKFRHGDNLTKRWLDRFFRSATEPWEKRKRRTARRLSASRSTKGRKTRKR